MTVHLVTVATSDLEAVPASVSVRVETPEKGYRFGLQETQLKKMGLELGRGVWIVWGSGVVWQLKSGYLT